VSKILKLRWQQDQLKREEEKQKAIEAANLAQKQKEEEELAAFLQSQLDFKKSRGTKLSQKGSE